MEDTAKSEAARALGAIGGRVYAAKLRETHTPEEISARMKAVRAQAISQFVKTDHLLYNEMEVRLRWYRTGNSYKVTGEYKHGEEFLPLGEDADIVAIYADAAFIGQTRE